MHTNLQHEISSKSQKGKKVCGRNRPQGTIDSQAHVLTVVTHAFTVGPRSYRGHPRLHRGTHVLTVDHPRTPRGSLSLSTRVTAIPQHHPFRCPQTFLWSEITVSSPKYHIVISFTTILLVYLCNVTKVAKSNLSAFQLLSTIYKLLQLYTLNSSINCEIFE